MERARPIRQARPQVKFCVVQIHKQLKRGKHFLFEHPIGSSVWKQPEIRNLKRKFGLYGVDMCACGLKCPESKKPIRKGTGIICQIQTSPKLSAAVAARSHTKWPKEQCQAGNPAVPLQQSILRSLLMSDIPVTKSW